MANETTTANVIVPEVFSDGVIATLTKASVFLPWAHEDTKTLLGEPGSTVQFPRYELLNEMADVNETDDLPIETLNQSTGFATVKEIGKAVAVKYHVLEDGTQVLNHTALDEATRQLGLLYASKLDTDLITAAKAETNEDTGKKIREQKPLKVTVGVGGKLSYDALVDATAVFGDAFVPDAHGLFVNSKVRATLQKDKDFIRAADLAKEFLVRGQVGVINGMRVFATDKLGDTDFLIVRHKAVGVIHKRRLLIEPDKDILGRKHVIAASARYAVKRISDKGVLVGTIQG